MKNNNSHEEMKHYGNAKGGSYRWVTITTLLLAVGAILHIISPNIGGVTPNWTIAMYTIAINLTRPTLGQSFGIGLVAAAINIPSSKSAFPYANLLSEPVGAITCALLVAALSSSTFGKFNLRPAVTGFITTLASGLTFITTLKVVLTLPLPAYLYVMLPVVFGVAAVNAVVSQLLYLPAKKLFDGKESTNAGDSNN